MDRHSHAQQRSRCLTRGAAWIALFAICSAGCHKLWPYEHGPSTDSGSEVDVVDAPPPVGDGQERDGAQDLSADVPPDMPVDGPTLPDLVVNLDILIAPDFPCGPTTCLQGCCYAGLCVPYSKQTVSRCGVGGKICTICAMTGATCTFGTCTSSCGLCNGCCSGSNCLTLSQQSDQKCGVGGAKCAGCQTPAPFCCFGICGPVACPTP